MAKLGDVFSLQITGEWGSECDTNQAGTKILRTTNFTSNGTIDYSNIAVRKIAESKIEKKRLKKGDIILEKSGGTEKTPVGRVVFCDKAIENDIYLCNNFTQAMRVNPAVAYPRYVFYFMWYLHYSGKTDLLQNKTTGIRNLRVKSYLDEKIPLPSLDEQRRIAVVLDKISDLIALRRAQLDKLDLLVKSRFVEMFGDPEVNSFKLPSIPMTNLCEIIDGDRGPNYPKQEEFSSDGYCLFLNAKNVTNSGFCFNQCLYISKEKDSLMRKGKLQRGDIVLTTRGTIGNLAFYDNTIPYENVRINSGMVILRVHKEQITEIFFIEQFKMLLDLIKSKMASGSAQPQLPISTMKQIMMLVPPIEEQMNFNKIVVQTNTLKSRVTSSLDSLETLKKSLMQQYFE